MCLVVIETKLAPEGRRHSLVHLGSQFCKRPTKAIEQRRPAKWLPLKELLYRLETFSVIDAAVLTSGSSSVLSATLSVDLSGCDCANAAIELDRRATYQKLRRALIREEPVSILRPGRCSLGQACLRVETRTVDPHGICSLAFRLGYEPLKHATVPRHATTRECRTTAQAAIDIPG